MQEPTVLSRLSNEFLCSMKFSWQICKAVPGCQDTDTYERIYQPKMIHLPHSENTVYACHFPVIPRVFENQSSMEVARSLAYLFFIPFLIQTTQFPRVLLGIISKINYTESCISGSFLLISKQN